MFVFSLLLLLPSCDNNGGDVELEEGTLTLTLTCNDLGLTRATIEGEDTYKENTIKSIDCYFYKKTDGFDVAAAVVKSIKNIQDAVGSYTTTIKFEQSEFEALFDKNATTEQQCLIYVIANYSGTLPIEDNTATIDKVETSINYLKGLVVESDFDNYTIDDNWSFVMDSKGNTTTDIATLSADKKSLTGEIPLYRTAAKITLHINRFGPSGTPGYVELGEDMYKPYLGGIYAVLHNGVKKSTIAPDAVEYNKSDDDYFTTDNFNLITAENTTSIKKPFYSYASDWNENDENEAYITLIVPWKKVNSADDDVNSEEGTEDYYYTVPVSYQAKTLLRNTHYKINISVSILGTLDPNQTVTITPSYEIIDWSSESIGTNMETFRYLEVEKNHYVMNNVNEIYIPYWSSHECEIVDVTITQPDLKNGGTKKYLTNDDEEDDFYKLEEKDYYLDNSEEDKKNKYIKYHLTLNNVYTSDKFDFAPYTITFTIQHTTESETYYEDIEIIQYPAIYGDYEENSDYTNGKNNDNIGYVYVNGYNDDIRKNGVDDFGTVPGNNSLGSRPGSQNRYIFTVTSVEGTPYVIGDPRDMNITFDEDDATWRTARQIVDGDFITDPTRELMYYYGTDVTSDLYTTYSRNQNGTRIYNSDADATAAERTINMVAPKFMLASGYALMSTGTTTVNRPWENLMKRCASYQEDGYPAGRWRLPTRAEFQLIMSQVDKGTLPEIYHKGVKYWCAHGVGEPQGNGVIDMTYIGYDSSRGNSTRCVYDLWYWGEHDKMDAGTTTFTWGDVPRSEKAYAPSINY